MCLQFGFTKQAYYKQLKTVHNTAAKNDEVLGLIKKKRETWKQGSGRNLHQSLKVELKQNDIKMGRDKFFDLLRDNYLLIKPKRRRAKTTCSEHDYKKHKNLIKDLKPMRANEIWVSDITYLWLKTDDRKGWYPGKFCYLSLVTDLYSRKIIGYCVHPDLSVNGTYEALLMALKQRPNKEIPLIHHSDRGVQYCCHKYTRKLKRSKIKISMTQTGDPLENAVAERINKTIKEEFTTDKQLNFANIAEAKTEIKKFIEFYNEQRPHRSLNWLTPNQAHLQTGELEMKWKSYYKSYQGGDFKKACGEQVSKKNGC